MDSRVRCKNAQAFLGDRFAQRSPSDMGLTERAKWFL